MLEFEFEHVALRLLQRRRSFRSSRSALLCFVLVVLSFKLGSTRGLGLAFLAAPRLFGPLTKLRDQTIATFSANEAALRHTSRTNLPLPLITHIIGSVLNFR